MNYQINLKIEPYLTQDQKTLAVLCYYRCPIDGKTESIVYTCKEGEDIDKFINKVKRILFMDQELNYEVKKRLINKLKRKEKKNNDLNDLQKLQIAFANNPQIDLNIEITEDDLR